MARKQQTVDRGRHDTVTRLKAWPKSSRSAEPAGQPVIISGSSEAGLGQPGEE